MSFERYAATRVTEARLRRARVLMTKELSALGQKIAGESAEPITRAGNQAFKKAS